MRGRLHRALVRGEVMENYQDSLAMQVELSSGCRLVAYAKTNRRVRLELRLNEYRIGQVLGSTRTSRTLESLSAQLGMLKRWTCDEFHQSMEHLMRQIEPLASRQNVVDLVKEVFSVVDDVAVARMVLEVLQSRGSLASPNGSPLKVAATQLSVAGVLRRRRSRNPVFVPCQEWEAAVRRLQGS